MNQLVAFRDGHRRYPPMNYLLEYVSKSKFADWVVENDKRIGRIIDTIRWLGIDRNTSRPSCETRPTRSS